MYEHENLIAHKVDLLRDLDDVVLGHGLDDDEHVRDELNEPEQVVEQEEGEERKRVDKDLVERHRDVRDEPENTVSQELANPRHDLHTAPIVREQRPLAVRERDAATDLGQLGAPLDVLHRLPDGAEGLDNVVDELERRRARRSDRVLHALELGHALLHRVVLLRVHLR
jgi:hypothetical protein